MSDGKRRRGRVGDAMASLEDCHLKALDRLCRICAGLLKRDSSKKLEVKKHQESLKAAFWIDNKAKIMELLGKTPKQYSKIQSWLDKIDDIRVV